MRPEGSNRVSGRCHIFERSDEVMCDRVVLSNAKTGQKRTKKRQRVLLTFWKSSGRPAAKTTVPSSSMTARPISAHTTSAMISNPSWSPARSDGLPPSSPSAIPLTARRSSIPIRPLFRLYDRLALTRSARSINGRQSRSTNRRIFAKSWARASSLLSNGVEWWSEVCELVLNETSKGFGFVKLLEKGV